MDFILDPGLVLYLPLYELDGVSFASREAHGHLSTVTGALWTPQGRSFDGIDDKVVLPDLSVTDLTIVAWVNMATGLDGSWRGIFGSDHDAHNGDVELLRSSNNMLDFYIKNNSPDERYWNTVFDDTKAGTFHYVGIAYSFTAKTYAFNLDGVPDGNGTYTTAQVPDLTSILAGRTYANRWWKGLIGELWVYNRAFSQAEFQLKYNVTKWRYQ